MRIQANPTALAAYGLTLEDLRAAIAAANVNQAKGGFDGPRQSSIIGANDQLFTGKEYRPLIVAYRQRRPGEALRCGRRHRRVPKTSSRRPG